MNSYVKDIVLCPPLGLCYIASNLSHRLGVDIRVIDCAILDLDMDAIRKEIKRFNPKILGLSTTTHTYKNALKIAGLAKGVNRRITTVLGGPHVTFEDEDALRNDQVDIVVRHEGEETMEELSSHLLYGKGDITSIRGITYRIKTSTRRNPDRPLIHDLDALPFPDRRLLPLHYYKIPASIITSRGCPSRCIFCAAEAMSGGRYRVRSPENVVEETRQIYSSIHPGFLFVADDTFTVFHERTRRICKQYRDLGIRWVCESRVNTVNADIIEEMADSGCFAIQFGVESGSQLILDSIRKGITVDQVRRAVKWCVDSGVQPVCSFMIPHPDDTWETIRETEALMEELKDMGAQIFVSLTTPFPGTALYERAENLGLEFVTRDSDEFNLATPVVRTCHLSVEEIEEAFDRLIRISTQTLPFELT